MLPISLICQLKYKIHQIKNAKTFKALGLFPKHLKSVGVFLYVTGVSIKGNWVKLVLLAIASPISEIMRSRKWCPDVSNMPP